MPHDDDDDKKEDGPPAAATQATNRRSPRRLFSVPEPVKRVFDKFPLRSYPANDLPRRSLRSRHEHTLYVFTDSQRLNAPSFNPGCLKWQAYLKFSGTAFHTISSNNHASPTGSLPFLLPAEPASIASTINHLPIPSNKLEKWVRDQRKIEEEPLNMRYEAYLSLLDHRIRNAWLYSLYLDDRNFDAVARRLYVDRSTSNGFVRAALSYQLRQAARDELLKYSAVIDVDDLQAEAGHAFEALSTLLGQDQHFFAQEKPGLLDASVFAYTHLILDDNLGWKNKRLAHLLQKHRNLVEHRQRLLEEYFENP